MDLFGAVFFGVIFLFCLRDWYEVWVTPEKFHKKIAHRRDSAKNFFGFSFWSQGNTNINSARFAYTFILIISLLGLMASIVGTNSGGR